MGNNNMNSNSIQPPNNMNNMGGGNMGGGNGGSGFDFDQKFKG